MEKREGEGSKVKVDGRIAIYTIKVSLRSPLTNICNEAPLGFAIFVEVLMCVIILPSIHKCARTWASQYNSSECSSLIKETSSSRIQEPTIARIYI